MIACKTCWAVLIRSLGLSAFSRQACRAVPSAGCFLAPAPGEQLSKSLDTCR